MFRGTGGTIANTRYSIGCSPCTADHVILKRDTIAFQTWTDCPIDRVVIVGGVAAVTQFPRVLGEVIPRLMGDREVETYRGHEPLVVCESGGDTPERFVPHCSVHDFPFRLSVGSRPTRSQYPMVASAKDLSGACPWT